ncbi:protease complex subunit PrcB family protein [Flavobacterium sp. RSB2_4_14]|uniref:protease complex subunit PrcB family protein n=1 Tax=Flavobacterium sp. RSB2_4_14 TaxID=3447665 RepID=UPI003F2B1B8C
MKKIILFFTAFLLFSCSTTKSVVENPLYEVLNYNSDGGANIKFYEILSEPNEIKMLLSDDNLRKKIKTEDLQNCNFIILNMGPLPEGNYNIIIDKVEETDENIILNIKEINPQSVENNPVNQTDYVYPYSVVKIKSKKPIIIK